MKEILKPYAALVEFLGPVLGPDYEVVLHDVGEENCVVAIVNGQNSGRGVGAPLTNKAWEIIEKHKYKTQDWEINYLGLSREGKTLRSSTYFIKDAAGELAGMLCVNFNDSRYRYLLRQVLRLCHPDEFAQAQENNEYVPAVLLSQQGDAAERFPTTAEETISEIVGKTLLTSLLPVERMTQEEKLEVVDKLNRRGVFAIKGAVTQVARALGSSDATVYRYLARVRRGEEGAAGRKNNAEAGKRNE